MFFTIKIDKTMKKGITLLFILIAVFVIGSIGVL